MIWCWHFVEFEHMAGQQTTFVDPIHIACFCVTVCEVKLCLNTRLDAFKKAVHLAVTSRIPIKLQPLKIQCCSKPRIQKNIPYHCQYLVDLVLKHFRNISPRVVRDKHHQHTERHPCLRSRSSASCADFSATKTSSKSVQTIVLG